MPKVGNGFAWSFLGVGVESVPPYNEGRVGESGWQVFQNILAETVRQAANDRFIGLTYTIVAWTGIPPKALFS